MIKKGDLVIHTNIGVGIVVTEEGCGVAFLDPSFKGHDCGGDCPQGRGWFVYKRDLSQPKDWEHRIKIAMEYSTELETIREHMEK